MISPNPARGDLVTYDFRRPSRISHDRQRTLEASHEQLAQALQGWVSNRLRAPFEVHLERVGQVPYGDFIGTLDDPGATFIYDIAGTSGAISAIYLDRKIAFPLVERLLGGGSVSEVPDRALTRLERVVIRIVTDRVAREMREVWKDHVDLELEWSRFESARELIEMTGRDEDVLAVTLRVEFGEVTGLIQIAVAFPVLESFFSRGPARRLQAPTSSSNERVGERSSIESLVRQADIVVAARLRPTRIGLRTLAALKAGDVLSTTIPSGADVEVHVAGSLRFVGRQGRLGPNMGVEITGTIGSG